MRQMLPTCREKPANKYYMYKFVVCGSRSSKAIKQIDNFPERRPLSDFPASLSASYGGQQSCQSICGTKVFLSRSYFKTKNQTKHGFRVQQKVHPRYPMGDGKR